MSAHKIDIDGFTLSFDQDILSDETHLVFLHGLQGRKEVFSNIRASLKNDFPFSQIAIDMVGFGDSSKPEDFSYQVEDQARIIEQQLATLSIRKVILVGHSVGGMIGTLLLNSPLLEAKAFVSLERNLTFEDCGKSRESLNLTFDAFSQKHQFFLESLKQSKKPAELLRLKALEKIPPMVFYKTSRAILGLLKTNQLYDLFVASEVPKLLLRGEKGHYRTVIGSELVVEKTIKDATHFMLLEQPELVYEAIKEYLQALRL